jgi:alcohol dehydrogenase, propanol-preferring
MVAVGLPNDTSVIAGSSPLDLALRRKNIVGSVTGTLKDVEEALDFTARGLVHPILTKGTLHDIDKFCELMIAGKSLYNYSQIGSVIDFLSREIAR